MGRPESDHIPVIASPRIAGKLTVLSLSPLDDDHLSVQAIIGHSTWVHLPCYELVSAVNFLQKYEVAVILCAEHLKDGTWVDVLDHISSLPDPPSLIVISKAANEHLWAEALNLGAWDVLAKPLDRREVIRSVKSGWQHRYDRTHRRAPLVKVMKAAG